MNQGIIDICNLALSRIGSRQLKQIAAFGEDSQEARLCRQLYPRMLTGMLRRHPWGFATVSEALALLHREDGCYVYAYPAKALYILSVSSREEFAGGLSGAGFEVFMGAQARVLRCALEAAYAFYISMIDDPRRFDPLFADALAWTIAAELSLSLAADAKLEQFLRERAAFAFELAKSSDANQGYAPLPEPYFITGRR
jgi:hypothetical protein